MEEKPIFAAIVNNHTLDYKEQGFENTKQFLTQNNIHHTVNGPLKKIIFCFLIPQIIVDVEMILYGNNI